MQAYRRRGRRARSEPKACVKLLTGTTRKPNLNVAWNPDLKLNPVNSLMLRGLVVHGEYWDTNAAARTAMSDVMADLYRGTPARS
jgi:hypothetical protein